jgi:glycerophosphoryl diester phosphodiesterase
MFRRRWVRRALVGSLVGLALLVVAVFADRSFTRQAGERRYEAVVAHLDATDPRWRYDEIDADRVALPDDRNGALLVPKFRAAVAGPLYDTRQRPGADSEKRVPPNYVLDDDTYEALDRTVADSRAALAVALEFADRPKGLRRYDLPLIPFTTPLPDVQETRGVVVLLDLAAEREGRDGRGGAALRYVQPMVNAARSLDGEPFLISALVRMACDRMAAKRVERTLGLAVPRGRLAAVQSLLAQEADADLFWYALRGERAVLDRMLTSLRTGAITLRDLAQIGSGAPLSTEATLDARARQWVYEPHLANDHATFLELLAEAYEARHQPEHEQRAALAAIEGRFRGLPFGARLTRLLTPSFHKPHDASLRVKAHLRCAVAGIAAERFRLARGRWPNGLDEIPQDILPAVPRDPFDGKPLKYARSDDGVTVYSVGLDGQDDGGTIRDDLPAGEPGQDVGFRLYDPDRRGLPALPSPPGPHAVFLAPDGEPDPADESFSQLGPEPRELEGEGRNPDQPVRAPPVEIIGHRGAAYDAPENTLAAMRTGWAQGADAVEFDLYLSKDGKIVVIHDKDTRRVAGVDRPVVGQTFDELRRFDVGKWKGPKFAGERIPTLTEILATVPAGKRAFIEVKCGPEIVPELKRDLAAAKLRPEQTAVISFSADVVAAVKKERADLKAYWLVGFGNPKKRPKKIPTPEEVIARAREIQADGLDLSADAELTPKYVKAATAAGLPVYVWTVNDPALAKQMIEAGVAGITTDRPGWLREQLRK